jgi:hypothetical protein
MSELDPEVEKYGWLHSQRRTQARVSEKVGRS